MIFEIIGSILIVTGTLFIFLASVGLLRLPDLYMRMSATTKASTLGVGLILIASAAYYEELDIAVRLLVILIFLFSTAPIAAHMIGRASYFEGIPLWKNSVSDDLKDKYDKKTHTLLSEGSIEKEK